MTLGRQRYSRVGIAAVGLLLVVAGAACTLPPDAGDPTGSPEPPAEGRAGTLVDVVDGDTVKVDLDGVTESVRVIGIDTPESRRPGTPVECFAREATAAAEGLLSVGDRVILEDDPTQDTRDRYGRLLAHVWLADGRLFAEALIRGGYGIHYVYDGVPSIHADRLAAAQAAAESAGSGLWAADTCAGDPHVPASATPG